MYKQKVNKRGHNVDMYGHRMIVDDRTQRACFRCGSLGRMYSTAGGWSKVNTGGKLVDCPLCLGKGTIPIMTDEIESTLKETTADIKGEESGKKRNRKTTEEA